MDLCQEKVPWNWSTIMSCCCCFHEIWDTRHGFSDRPAGSEDYFESQSYFSKGRSDLSAGFLVFFRHFFKVSFNALMKLTDGVVKNDWHIRHSFSAFLFSSRFKDFFDAKRSSTRCLFLFVRLLKSIGCIIRNTTAYKTFAFRIGLRIDNCGPHSVSK